MPPFSARHLIDDIDKVFIIVTRATAADFRPLANLLHILVKQTDNILLCQLIIAVMALALF